MYVRASDACNQLAITQPEVAGDIDATWSIRIDQVNETDEMLRRWEGFL